MSAGGSGLGHALRAFRHRDFAIFWSGAVVSNSGTWLQGVAVPYVLFEITRSATWVGLATFAAFIPIMVMGPIGGYLADRRSRRLILVVGQSTAALFALALWAVFAAGVREPWVVLSLTALMSSAAGITIPSWQAFIPALVPREDLPSAITLNSVQFNAARAIGPAAAGIVLASLGPGAAFLLNGLSYVAVVAAVLAVRTTAPPLADGARSLVRGFGEAFSYLTRHAGIWRGIVVAMLVGFVGYPIVQFTVVYAETVYGVGPRALGVLTGAIGVGAIAVAPVVGGALGDIARARTVRIALPVYGLAVAVFGLSTTYGVGIAAVAVAGAGFLAIVATTNTAAQAIVAEHFRGRVMAIRVMGFTAAYPLGGLLQGWLADRWGPAVVVTAAGSLLVAIGVALAVRSEWLTPLDDPPEAYAA
jgi:MFS family permease